MPEQQFNADGWLRAVRAAGMDAVVHGGQLRLLRLSEPLTNQETLFRKALAAIIDEAPIDRVTAVVEALSREALLVAAGRFLGGRH